MASELHPWRFELAFFQVGYPVVISHFAATPQSDVVHICAHDFRVMVTLLVRQIMPVFMRL